MNPLEERFYETAALEITEKRVKTGVFAKAFSMALGDKDKACALYISMRVQELVEEHAQAQAEVQAREEERASEENARQGPMNVDADRKCTCGHRESQHRYKGRRAPCDGCGCGDFLMAL